MRRCALTPAAGFAGVVGAGLALLLFFGPAGTIADAPTALVAETWQGVVAIVAPLAAGLGIGLRGPTNATLRAALVGPSAFMLGMLLLVRLDDGLVYGGGGVASWIVIAAIAVMLWQTMGLLAPRRERVWHVVIPLIFGGLLIFLWEVLTVGFAVPGILLPAPSVIFATFVADLPTLWVDFHQTFIRSAVPGFLIGCGSGVAVAIAIDRSPFLQRGLLPLGSLVSAMPIVGIAPIMVMWFGFDWHSKAAVVVIMTFFPTLVNTTAGLQATAAMERDLMRSYGADYWQTLLKLRLPAALPYVLNALKLCSTLALIGAIVAEFFGTPIYGMGFRISTEVARLNVDKVWATIAVAAIAGSASYGMLVLLERVTTFWHPSQRATKN